MEHSESSRTVIKQNRCLPFLFLVTAIVILSSVAKPLYAESCYLQFGRKPLSYFGEFVLSSSSSERCSGYFSTKKYATAFTITGNDGDGGLLSLRSDQPEAFFRGVTFYGPVFDDCQFVAVKSLTNPDGTTTVFNVRSVVSGTTIFTRMVATLQVLDRPICTATAEYTGTSY